MKFFIIISLFILSIVHYTEAGYASGFLLVDKVFDEKSVVINRPFNVEIRIYNAGSGIAYNTVLLESSFAPENFTFVSGEINKKFPQIEPNQNVTIQFTLMPVISGPVEDKPAFVSYVNSPYNDAPIRALSTFKRFLYVLTEDEYHLYSADHSREWSVFGLLMGILVGFPGAQYWLYSRSGMKNKFL